VRAVTRRRIEPAIHYVPSVSAFSEAIRLGLGWGMVPEPLFAHESAAGHCIDIAPGRHLEVPLFWQHWRLESDVLNALTAAVKVASAGVLR
jgi:LysR family transcriptional regulator (chromosome initiation inhibitor)